MFSSVLVANRGEIAVRVISTLRRLGIRSVAVYSDADADAVHVRVADEAVRIGPAPAAQSYLDIDAVVAAARATGAQAIHPGYGFLSENAAFARACAAAGIVFIGPGERALSIMGDKLAAKQHVAAFGVPVVPGAGEPGWSDERLVAAAAEVGYPLLIKPSAGGGGKGMQLVRTDDELADGIRTARRVAAAAFGDDTLLLERFIERPRHIEVQVLADAAGTTISLGERECSLQRRHQKVIEEAPSPLLDAATRARIGAAACDAARSVDYLGAGTVEFLVSADAPDTFFFIEMNTRLQVEHPVTELVTGVDLVEQQLRIASGEPLSIAQTELEPSGHAVEARVYAESPERGFLPATGAVLDYVEPAGAGVRVDSGIGAGSVVTADYDPMLAKVIAHGATRAEALKRLDAALAGTVILGVDTNIAFLRTLLADPTVMAGEADTGLIDRMPAIEATATVSDDALGALAAALPIAERVEAPGMASALWRSRSGWRLGAAEPRVATFLVGGQERTVRVPERVEGPGQGGIRWARDGDTVWVHADGRAAELRVLDREALLLRHLAAVERDSGPAHPELRAPMPGTVVSVAVATGDTVEEGQTIASIEAMKMEHRITAPIAGTVTVHVDQGEQVSRDRLVATVTATSEE